MGKYAQLVMGPAGSGKSTFCKTIQTHCANIGRSVHCFNLDPAAEDIGYQPSVDIRDLITVDEVMDEMKLGPNGGLVYCMEFLGSNFDWLHDEVDGYEEDYLIIDCPGQLELYSHIPVMKNFVNELELMNYRVCAVYLLDSHFISDSSKFVSGSLQCLSAMVLLEIPHINVLSKMDLIDQKGDSEEIERILDMEVEYLISELDYLTSDRYSQLNKAIGGLLTDYSMVSFVPLNVNDEDSISLVLQHIDHCLQYGEDEEVKEPKDLDEDGEDNFNVDL